MHVRHYITKYNVFFIILYSQYIYYWTKVWSFVLGLNTKKYNNRHLSVSVLSSCLVLPIKYSGREVLKILFEKSSSCLKPSKLSHYKIALYSIVNQLLFYFKDNSNNCTWWIGITRQEISAPLELLVSLIIRLIQYQFLSGYQYTYSPENKYKQYKTRGC